jgi:benzil reductase ((S)-benzoin forming)
MKYIIITGASKGLGEGIALELLDQGSHLLCVARSSSQMVLELAESKALAAEFINFDLSSTGKISELIDILFEKIDPNKASGVYLINNAGVIEPVDRVENFSAKKVEAHLKINLLAPMLLSSGFISRTKGWEIQKRILNISSGAATSPYYGWSSYCTSKAGLDMFTRCISTEQQSARYPVHIMGVAPGVIDTGMQTRIRSTSEEQFIHRQRFVELKETGQLIPPRVAGRRIAELLLSESFRDGTITDIRHSY